MAERLARMTSKHPNPESFRRANVTYIRYRGGKGYYLNGSQEVVNSLGYESWNWSEQLFSWWILNNRYWEEIPIDPDLTLDEGI